MKTLLFLALVLGFSGHSLSETPSCDCKAVSNNISSKIADLIKNVEDVQQLPCTKNYQDKVDEYFLTRMSGINTALPCKVKRTAREIFNTKCKPLNDQMNNFNIRIVTVTEAMADACRCGCEYSDEKLGKAIGRNLGFF